MRTPSLLILGPWLVCMASAAVEPSVLLRDDACADGATGCALGLLHISDRKMMPLEERVASIAARIPSQPDESCSQILELLEEYREPGPAMGAFGARLSRMEILEAGIGELAAQGVLQSLATEESKSSLPPAGYMCFNAICSMGVQYNHERSVALYENSPHLWDAVVAWNRRVVRNHDLLRIAVVTFAGIYGVPPSEQALYDLGKAGGFDVMFDILRNNASDLVVAQAAWAGISDNVENFRVGAMLAADHGGPGKGIEELVNIIKQYHGKHAYQPGMPYGLRYESIHDINGILFWDEDNTWLNAAVNAGFLEEALLAMQEEPNDQFTCENGCEALSLGLRNPANQARLKEMGAIEQMVEVISRFRYRTSSYSHLNSCSSGLLPFAQASTENQDTMLQLGLFGALEVSIPLWAPLQESRRDPWKSTFPWSDVTQLQEILAKRQAA